MADATLYCEVSRFFDGAIEIKVTVFVPGTPVPEDPPILRFFTDGTYQQLRDFADSRVNVTRDFVYEACERRKERWFAPIEGSGLTGLPFFAAFEAWFLEDTTRVRPR